MLYCIFITYCRSVDESDGLTLSGMFTHLVSELQRVYLQASNFAYPLRETEDPIDWASDLFELQLASQRFLLLNLSMIASP